MTDQYGVNIYLMITSIDLETGDKYILTIDNIIPCLPLHHNTNIATIINSLCENYVNLDVSWINIKCCYTIDGFSTDENNTPFNHILNIYYHGMIPYDTPLKNKACFISINDFNDPVVYQPFYNS